MEGPNSFKARSSSDDSNAGSSPPRIEINCQLCEAPVASMKDSGDEYEFQASLKWLRSFLVRVKCLEESNKRLLTCSAAQTCENCKSNLYFVKKHGELAVQQHAKVKWSFEKLTDDLETLQRTTGPLTMRLQTLLESPGSFQGELPRAIGKAFGSFKGLQDTNSEVLNFLNLKCNPGSGLILFPNIGAVNDPVVKTEESSGAGTNVDESDGEENVDPMFFVTSADGGTHGDEENVEMGMANAPAVNPDTTTSSGGGNEVEGISIESSYEAGTDAAEDGPSASCPGEKSKEIAPLKKTAKSSAPVSDSNNNACGFSDSPGRESKNRENSETAPSRKQEKRIGNKRKLSEDEISTSSEKENSCETAFRDAEPAKLPSLPKASTFSEAVQAPPIARPSKMSRSNQTFKKIRISVEKSGNVEGPPRDGNGERQPKQLSVKTVNVDVISAGNWAEKLKVLESGAQEDAITLLQCMSYLKPDYIPQNVLYNLPQGGFHEKIDTAVKYLLKHGFVKMQKMDHKIVLSISPDLQMQVQANLWNEGLERGVLDSLMILFSRLNRQTANGDQVGGRDELLEENIEHALSVWQCAVYYPETIRSHSGLLCDTLEILEHENKSLQEKGIELGKTALENFTATLTSQHEDCIKLEKSLLVLLYEVGMYEESADNLKALCKKYENILKERDDPDLLLEIRAELGEALVLLGRFEEALTIQCQVLEKTRNKKGEEAIDTIVQENRYGRFLSKAGKDQEAMKMFKSVEEKERKVKPENQTLIVEAQMNVALTYSDMAKDEEALKIWKDAYKTISSRRDRNFELFAEISFGLGRVLLDMKNFTEAMEHLSTDYEIVKEELGKDHFWTLRLLQSLGSAHRGNGTDTKKLETALILHQDAYRGLLEEYGEEDDDAIYAKDDLALDLSMLGRHEEALQINKENISKLESWKRFPDRLMEYKLNYVEALEKSGESLEEVLRQYEAIKEEFEKKEGKKPRQIKRASDLIHRVQEKLQSK